MITRQQVDQLRQFHPSPCLITSCYLNLDRAQQPPQTLKIRIKDLVQTAQHELDGKTAGHGPRESLRRDFEQIEAFLMQELTTNQHKGLAIFSCAQEKFWQVYELPRMVRNILIADHAPYIRPLETILEEYHRYGVVVADRVAGQVYEVYMGQILERSDVIDRVPRRVREAGLGGRDERTIERHHDKAVHDHYQHLSDATFALFQRDHFDWLILGGHPETLTEFKEHLHPYLKERWVGDFQAEPRKTAAHEILKQSLQIESRVELAHERRLADELVQKTKAGHRAVTGVGATLQALTRAEAQLLLVEEGFEMPGFACYACHYVDLETRACPRCQKPLEPCPDIVDEAIELAMRTNCQVEHVYGATPLRDQGRMGALLRFRAGA